MSFCIRLWEGAATMSKGKRAAAALLLLSLISCACGEKEREIQVREVTQSALEEEQTVAAVRGDLEICEVREGYVSPKVHQMKFETQGKFGEYKVKTGDSVREGQTLATLNPTPYAERVEELKRKLGDLLEDYTYEKSYNEKTIEAYGAQIEGYQAQLEDPDREWKEGEREELDANANMLLAQQKRLELVNRQLGETYDLEHDYLQGQLNDAQQEASQIAIKSPCDGVVIALQDVNGAEYTDETMYYAAVAEQNVCCVRCEAVAGRALNSMQKICGISNGREYDLKYVPYDSAVLREMRNNGEEIYTNFEILNADGELAFGDSMIVKLVSQIRKDVLYLPDLAIGSDESGYFVYKKTEKGREKVMIKRGSRDGLYTEIKSGIEEGDVVYVQN